MEEEDEAGEIGHLGEGYIVFELGAWEEDEEEGDGEGEAEGRGEAEDDMVTEEGGEGGEGEEKGASGEVMDAGEFEEGDEGVEPADIVAEFEIGPGSGSLEEALGGEADRAAFVVGIEPEGEVTGGVGEGKDDDGERGEPRWEGSWGWRLLMDLWN